MAVLLLSSSKAGDSGYLETGKAYIYDQVADCQNIVFIPYAGVSITNDEYTAKVQEALPEVQIKGIYTYPTPQEGIEQADAILVGGGNTFHLLYSLYQYNLVDVIRKKVASGCQYIGWSAGSNVAGKSIRTTNDMPIIEPPTFDALSLVPFQINPHYTSYQPPGHNGETRVERLQEFMLVNPTMPVLAIPEGTGLLVNKTEYEIVGSGESFVFIGGEQTLVQNQQHLNQLLPINS